MKKLILVVFLSLSISGISQVKKNHINDERPEFTTEQQNELQIKQLILELDLTAKQQKEISEIMANQQLKREAMKAELQKNRSENIKLTSDEKFVLKSKVLDERIAMKSQMKKILTPEQLAKWEKMPKHTMKKEKARVNRNPEFKN